MLKLLGNVIIAVKFWSTQSPLGFLQSVAYTSRVLSYMREGLCIEETLSLQKFSYSNCVYLRNEFYQNCYVHTSSSVIKDFLKITHQHLLVLQDCSVPFFKA